MTGVDLRSNPSAAPAASNPALAESPSHRPSPQFVPQSDRLLHSTDANNKTATARSRFGLGARASSPAAQTALLDAHHRFAARVDELERPDPVALRQAALILVQPDWHLLDLGCGMAEFSIEATNKGATVTAVDRSRKVVALARGKVDPEARVGRLTVVETSMLDYQARPGETDMVYCSLALSELKPLYAKAVMLRAFRWLKPNGLLVIIDRVPPQNFVRQKVEGLGRAVGTSLTTWPLGQPLVNMQGLVSGAGFRIKKFREWQPERLAILLAERSAELNESPAPGLAEVPSLNRVFSAWTTVFGGAAVLLPWMTFPIQPGLYRVGNPTPESPVVVVGNPLRWLRFLRRQLAAHRPPLDHAWILVVATHAWWTRDAMLLNGMSTARILTLLDATQLAQRVTTRRMLLTPTAAPCMQGIIERTDWRPELL